MTQPAAPKSFQSLDQLFEAEIEQRRRLLDTPEQRALEAERTRRARARAAEAEAAPEEAVPPYQAGKDAALRAEEREAPEGLSGKDRAEWLAGYDSEAEDDQ